MQCDVIVVGGGHAGVEAAAAAARRGAATVLITQSQATIGTMSCNPSIGGVGKGHIVREVDAFDGIMAVAADAAAIHHRMLNGSKGVAVQGPRIQADRLLYCQAVAGQLNRYDDLSIVEGEVVDLIVRSGRVEGLRLVDGSVVLAPAVVLATGTFLGGRLFRGDERWGGGRIGDAASMRLADRLGELGFRRSRLKTGTPPRIDGRTIDWAVLDPQPSDREPWTMSPASVGRSLPQVACAIARTVEATHAAVRAALDRSPVTGGAIEGRGPRYCPSIEDKIVRFGDRDGHQVFLEPEGLSTPVVYPNGLSTSLPRDAQAAMIASIPGLERARIVEFGYAVEYDMLDPRLLDATLECRTLPGLFCAGQINGTTGYEEAAGQGLVAGLNAAARARSAEGIVFDRRSSYIGVMVDDLTLQGVSEPYRMLTARAEYRLSLRADNAEARLGMIAMATGCLGPARAALTKRRLDALATLHSRIDREQATVMTADGPVRRTLATWIGSDQNGPALEALSAEPVDLVRQAIADVRYAPYVERQQQEDRRRIAEENMPLAVDLDYAAVPGLSGEMIDRLDSARPETLGKAARIAGMTPAAVTAVLLHQRRNAQ